MINIVVTSKPSDGLFCYSYEHCCYLNSVGISSRVIVITNHKFSKQDYLDNIKEKYVAPYQPIVFDEYTPNSDDISLIMGRSMLTLPYKDRADYTKNQLLTLHLLFHCNLISVYAENHNDEWPFAMDYFNVDKIYDLCDYEVYKNGVGTQFEKMINFSVYKPVVDDIKFDYLFLGTNEIYYKEVMKHIDKYPSHGILSYDHDYLDKNLNNIIAPVKNLLGTFKTYVYTKTYFDPAPRLLQECKWLGKEIIYLRDKNKKDGGPVYMKRPVPTKKIYSDNINILIEKILKIRHEKNIIS
tara:strand:+ start:1803 stop:2693 length:891 start_codon:yes stop_codon:yes gene_type:complete